MVTEGGEGTPVGRRVFLGMLGLGAAGVVWGAKASDAVSQLLAPITARDGSGLTSLIPSGGRFRYFNVANFVPHRSREEYRLRVRGLVDRPLDLTYDDLLAMPRVGLVKDFQCVTGWRVHDVPWEGVLLSHVLDAAGVRPDAGGVVFGSYDDIYAESLTLEQARRPDVIVALEMEGKPITDAHGGPVRMYVAPMYGYKSLKWLGDIYVAGEALPGYWEQRGYDIDGWIGRSNGRDDAPA